jgi:AraC-like DNA-binding protein
MGRPFDHLPSLHQSHISNFILIFSVATYVRRRPNSPIRKYRSANVELKPGWLQALQDQVVGRALGLLHAEPALAWTVEGLAEKANISWSAFARLFSGTSRPTSTDLSCRVADGDCYSSFAPDRPFACRGRLSSRLQIRIRFQPSF